MVKVLCRGRGFNSLVRELTRSCMLCFVTKKKKKSEYYPSPVTLSFPQKKKKLLMNLEGELSTQPLVIKKEYFFIVYKQEQEKAY